MSPPPPGTHAAPGALEHECRILKRAVAILHARMKAMEEAIAGVGAVHAMYAEAQGKVELLMEALAKERQARYTAEAHLRVAQSAGSSAVGGGMAGGGGGGGWR